MNDGHLHVSWVLAAGFVVSIAFNAWQSVTIARLGKSARVGESAARKLAADTVKAVTEMANLVTSVSDLVRGTDEEIKTNRTAVLSALEAMETRIGQLIRDASHLRAPTGSIHVHNNQQSGDGAENTQAGTVR